MKQSSTRRYRRPARWMPGPAWSGGPSHQAKALLRTPPALPHGLWCADAEAAALLRTMPLCFKLAEHPTSGQVFLLAYLPDGPALGAMAVSPGAQATLLTATADGVTAWLEAQRWQYVPGELVVEEDGGSFWMLPAGVF